MPRFSRRGFSGLLLAPFFRLHGQSTPTAPATPSPGARDGAPSRIASRTYRADALITFLGVTIYRRTGVGGGQASLEETGEGVSLRRTFFFAAGSDPRHAHGLNRLGWIREVVLGPDSAPVESAYFGVLTSSPEESLEHARRAVADPPSGRIAFSAVNGRNTVGHSRSAITHFDFPAEAGWSDHALIEHAQSTFHENVVWRETSWPKSPDQTPPTFLLLLTTLLKQRARHAVGRYVYNEQEYVLELDAQQPGRDRLLPIHGKIRNERTRYETLFRVWMDEASNSVVPVRIEFQARSYLRLTFEALPA